MMTGVVVEEKMNPLAAFRVAMSRREKEFVEVFSKLTKQEAVNRCCNRHNRHVLRNRRGVRQRDQQQTR